MSLKSDLRERGATHVRFAHPNWRTVTIHTAAKKTLDHLGDDFVWGFEPHHTCGATITAFVAYTDTGMVSGFPKRAVREERTLPSGRRYTDTTYEDIPWHP